MQICTCFDSVNHQPHSRLVSQILNTCSLKNAYMTIVRVMTLGKLCLLVQVKQIANVNSDKQKTIMRVFQFLMVFQQRPTILLWSPVCKALGEKQDCGTEREQVSALGINFVCFRSSSFSDCTSGQSSIQWGSKMWTFDTRHTLHAHKWQLQVVDRRNAPRFVQQISSLL